MKKHSIHLISHALHNTIGSVRVPSAPTQLHLSSLPATPVAWSVSKPFSQPAAHKRSLSGAKINKISLSATPKLPNASIYPKIITLYPQTPPLRFISTLPPTTPQSATRPPHLHTISNKKAPAIIKPEPFFLSCY